MSQVLFAALTAPSLVSLDANFSELYSLKNAFGTSGYAAASPTTSATYFWDGTSMFGFGTNAPWAGQASILTLSYAGSGSNIGVTIRTASSGTSYAFNFLNGGSDNGVGTPTRVGSITTTSSATAYNTTSDRRLKCRIAPATDSGSLIDAIGVVSHSWLNDGDPVRFGFIAQDLYAVFPEAVRAGDTGDEVTETWGVDPSKMVALLVKEVQSLRSRVAALEAR